MRNNIVQIIVLFIFWAFFAGSETAYISINRFKLNSLRKQGKKNALLAHFLINKPERLFATSLMGTNICLVLAANLTSVLFFQILSRPAPIVSVVVITLLSLILCEIIPKNLAIKHSLEITLLSAIPMYFFYILFFPIGKFFIFCSKIVIRISGISYTGFGPGIFKKKEDVEIFLQASLKEKFTKDERRFFLESIDIGNKELTDIMVPLVEIQALPVDAKIKQCSNFIRKHKKFYIPVYRGRIDNIEGIIYAHDIFGIDEDLPLDRVVKEPVFVPENNKINEVYRKLNKINIPVVFTVDEHGGVTGMVTIYDIGEEIIGKVGVTEYDRNHVIKIKDGEYMCEGDAEIDEVNRLLNININTSNVSHLNGLIVKKLCKIPEKEDFIEIEGHRFLVVKSNKRKAELIQITKINSQNN